MRIRCQCGAGLADPAGYQLLGEKGSAGSQEASSGRGRRHSGCATGRPVGAGPRGEVRGAGRARRPSSSALERGERARTPHRSRTRHGPARPRAPRRASTILKPGGRGGAGSAGPARGGGRSGVSGGPQPPEPGLGWGRGVAGRCVDQVGFAGSGVGTGSVAEGREQTLAPLSCFSLSRSSLPACDFGGREQRDCPHPRPTPSLPGLGWGAGKGRRPACSRERAGLLTQALHCPVPPSPLGDPWPAGARLGAGAVTEGRRGGGGGGVGYGVLIFGALGPTRPWLRRCPGACVVRASEHLAAGHSLLPIN